MSPAVALPQHRLSESPTSRAINIYDWHVTATTTAISNAQVLDALHAALGIPLPEMTFGGNKLELQHKPTGWTYAFSVEDALRAVKNGPMGEGDGGVRVGYADAWLNSRTTDALDATEPAKPYDWTYTTTYGGHIAAEDGGASCEWEDGAGRFEIPIAELTRPDPILFYAEVPLFEDELHDNGASHLLVRIRVMPTCIFILCRATLRVDNVLFRMHDTRIYLSFESSPPTVIREMSGFEAAYDRVARLLPSREDKTPLTDPNFIGKALAGMPKDVAQGSGAGTGWRGLGTKLEVMKLLDMSKIKIAE